MSDNPIKMSDVLRRKFLLESSKLNVINVSRTFCESVKQNPTKERVSYFLDRISRSGIDCSIYFEESLNMVNDLQEPDIQKQPMIQKINDQIIPRVNTDVLKGISDRLSDNTGILCSDKIKNKIDDVLIMDRILKNDETLSKRFDFDKIIRTNSCENLEDVVKELCSLLDTYQLSLEAKYNIALENFSYLFFKNNIPYNINSVLEYVTDYFLESRLVLRDKDVDGIVKVLNNNRIIKNYTLECRDLIDSMFNNKRYAAINEALSNSCNDERISRFISESRKINNEKQAAVYIDKGIRLIATKEMTLNDKENLMSSIMTLPLIGKVSKPFVNSQIQICETKNNYRIKINDDIYLEYLDEALKDEYELLSNAELVSEYVSLKNDIFANEYKEKDFIESFMESETFADSNDIKEVLDKFKADQNKSIGRFKNCMIKIYRKSPENIIDETPHILAMIRAIFIVGSFAIPTVGPAIGIILAFVDHMISSRINDQQTAKLITALEYEKKLAKEKLEKGKGNKSDLEKYVKCLDQCINKCDHYRNSITDQEIEGRSNSDDTDDDDFLGDDLDFEFESSKIIIKSNMISYIMETYADNDFIESITCKIPFILVQEGSDLVDYGQIVKMANIDPEVIRIKIKDNYKLSVQESTYLLTSTQRSQCYPIPKDDDDILFYQYYSLKALKEMVSICEDKIAYNESVKDKSNNKDKKGKSPSFNLNSLKLIMQNFKGKVKDLSTKEKAAWQTIDAAMSGFVRSAEKAMTSDRREAIIKGSIIPSFSKCIKTSLVIGGVTFINPIAGLITAMGILGCSKVLNERERQLIYDEIDTELKVIDKEIQMAENDGDMKKYRFMLQYQKKLEREKYRIKYGIKAKGRDIPAMGRDD